MKFKIAIITILVLWIQIQFLYGHAPSNVTLNFDKETRLLEVKYEHKVGDTTQHYVFDVTIQLNDKEIITQTLGSQDDNTGGSLIYKIIDAKPGSELKVQLTCIRVGSKSASIKIE